MAFDGDLAHLTATEVAHLSEERFKEVAGALLSFMQEDRKLYQLYYYKPVSEQSLKIHQSRKRIIGVGGGNRSSKTETCMVEMFSLACGIRPVSLAKKTHWDEKFRGPVRLRVVCQSLTTTLRDIILPKLQWWKWQGADEQGGERGHWGWIPKDHLIGGDWQQSWLEKTRTLRFLCKDPDNPGRTLGESTCQFMSHDQDPADFASGEFEHILHDEPPRYAIWRENEARAMSVGGRLLLAMTWPDDPSIPVDWIFDEVYEPGMGDDEQVEWIELDSRQNQNIDQESLRRQEERWGVQLSNVRIRGQPIRFANRVHGLYTDYDHHWCFKCKGQTNVHTVDGRDTCATCGGPDVAAYNHCVDFPVLPGWPVICLLDPHPRKPHFFMWVAIDANDDWWACAELKAEGNVIDVAEQVRELERFRGFDVRARIMDPKMGAQQSRAGLDERITWRDEFSQVGLYFDLADFSPVGRDRVDMMLRPDEHTRRPRLHVHRKHCSEVNEQMKRFVWDDYKISLEKDQKQVPKEKNDDFPALFRYLANADATSRSLEEGQQIIHRRKLHAQAKQVRRYPGGYPVGSLRH